MTKSNVHFIADHTHTLQPGSFAFLHSNERIVSIKNDGAQAIQIGDEDKGQRYSSLDSKGKALKIYPNKSWDREYGVETI